VDTGPLLERDLAPRAGLGFVGKHTNLISRPTRPIGFSSPGDHHNPPRTRNGRAGKKPLRFLHALHHGLSDERHHRAVSMDARRCISYLTIELKGSIPVKFRSAIGNRIYGLRRLSSGRSVEQILARRISDEGTRAARISTRRICWNCSRSTTLDSSNDLPKLRCCGRSVADYCAMFASRWEMWGDETALPALEKARRVSEPLIAEHARWAD